MFVEGRIPDTAWNSVEFGYVDPFMNRNGRSRSSGIASRSLLLGAALLLVLSACSQSEVEPPAVTYADPSEAYDPVRAGEELPEGYRQLLGRDQIAPIYDPTFKTPVEVDWPSDMLVIGVAGSSEAKAYPVTHLNQREMVIDSLEGIPILVTW